MNRYELELKTKIITNTITMKCGLPHIKVYIDYDNQTEVKGLYFFKQRYIKIFPIFNGKKRDWKDILETLFHEVAHYYQHHYYDNLEHNKNFFIIIIYLKEKINSF